MTTTTLNTTSWVSYPFTVNGINFVSKVDPKSSIGFQVNLIPVEIFNSMNSEAVLDIIGNPATLTLSELVSELIRVNHSASEAIIELAGE
jgi:hypothetical protein